MRKKGEGWDVSAVVWVDASTRLTHEGCKGTVPMVSFGVACVREDDEEVHVVHDLSAEEGGKEGAVSSIPLVGMKARVIYLARLPVPPEFANYWDKVSRES